MPEEGGEKLSVERGTELLSTSCTTLPTLQLMFQDFQWKSESSASQRSAWRSLWDGTLMEIIPAQLMTGVAVSVIKLTIEWLICIKGNLKQTKWSNLGKVSKPPRYPPSPSENFLWKILLLYWMFPEFWDTFNHKSFSCKQVKNSWPALFETFPKFDRFIFLKASLKYPLVRNWVVVRFRFKNKYWVLQM